MPGEGSGSGNTRSLHLSVCKCDEADGKGDSPGGVIGYQNTDVETRRDRSDSLQVVGESSKESGYSSSKSSSAANS